MKKKWFHNKTKSIIQLAILAFMLGMAIVGGIKASYTPDFEAYCPFGGLMSLGSKLNIGTMSCTMSENQVYIGIAFAIVIVFFGKLFCGWLCPVGTVSEWLNKLGRRIGLSKDIKGVTDRVLRWLKYILLFLTAYITMTSSELFCKQFDPYFATATGFGPDTVLLYGIISIFIVVVLSTIFKQFWCKYICPLGALSNIIANIYITAPIMIIFIILRTLGVNIGIFWLLLALALSAALTESIRYKFFGLSKFKIRINKDTCTSCKICDNHCPQGIEVSSYEEVTHPDCNLCMDCVKSCPQKGTNTVKWGTWWPPVVLVVTFALALILAQQNPMATLSERWGNFDQADSLGQIEKVEFQGLKTVKCYGSAFSMYSKLKRKPGVVGMDAWASKHNVTLYYDSSKLSETDVKRYLFTPSKYNLKAGGKPEVLPEILYGYDLGIIGLWDGIDNTYMYRLLQKNDDIYGFKTQFGEPVHVTVYFDPAKVSLNDIRELIALRKYEYESKGEVLTQKIKFEIEEEMGYSDTLSFHEFRQDFFVGYDRGFNDYRKYDKTEMKIMEIDFAAAENGTLRRKLPYLTSHLSFDEGIVRMKTSMTDKPVLQVYFIPTLTDPDKIMTLLQADMLKFMTRDKTEKEIENIFKFNGKFEIKSLK